MNVAGGLSREVWCVDLKGPHPLARETAKDRIELARGGAARLFRRRLLRAALAQRWSVHPDALCFHRETSGEVRVTAPRPAFISTAQRGHMVVMAVAETPVGVDVEPIGSVKASDIESLCPAWPDLDPTARWTTFEALGKLFSVGTAVPVEAVATLSSAPGERHLSWEGRKVRIALFTHSDHQIAVAEFEP
jgi:hypothetical protein